MERPSQPNQGARALLISLLALLCLAHLVCSLLSTRAPSWDEAHYMSGAREVYHTLSAFDVGGFAHQLMTLLGFKPPLLALLGGFSMLAIGPSTAGALIFLSVNLILCAWASYHLFKQALPKDFALLGSLFLVSSPLVTGLTQRFYTENLFLLLALCSALLAVRAAWTSWAMSLALGVCLGLGFLTKTTFAFFVAPAIGYLLVIDFLKSGEKLATIGRAFCSGLIALGVALPWYLTNFEATLRHAQNSRFCEECFYPSARALLLEISLLSSPLTLCLAVIGIIASIKLGFWSRSSPASRSSGSILILGVTTLAATVLTQNKATRFCITAAPLFAFLAAGGLYYLLRSSGSSCRRWAIASIAALSFLLAGWMTLGPKAPAIRIGDYYLAANAFPLNVPGWFDDYEPLDRREWNYQSLTSGIEINRKASVRIAVATDCLFLSHDLLSFVANDPRKEFWPWTPLNPETLPDYLVVGKDVGNICTGSHWTDHSSSFYSLQAQLPFHKKGGAQFPNGAYFELYERDRN